MNSINLALMIILSAIIGFAIGNVWGKESMKRTISSLLNDLTKGLKLYAKNTQDKKEE